MPTAEAVADGREPATAGLIRRLVSVAGAGLHPLAVKLVQAALPGAACRSSGRCRQPACSPADNKKKILAALKRGPKTASEIANETGIKANTVSASLTKFAKTGEVVKAVRGYALPSVRTNDRRSAWPSESASASYPRLSQRAADPAPRYRVRWDDGHESIYTPASGALRAEPRPRRQRQSTPRKR